MHLLKQAAQPLRNTNKRKLRNYNDCPQCKGQKKRSASTCRKCQLANNRPPQIREVFVVDGLSCRKIPLTQNQYAIVDADIYDWLMQWNWHAAWNSCAKAFYATRWDKKSRSHVAMHRIIARLRVSRRLGDHINGNSLDNRRKNIRGCTNKQNPRNHKINARNTSGFHGVVRCDQRWASRISVKGRWKHLGYFRTAKDAAVTRDAAAIRHYGRFATLNFPNQFHRGAS